MPQLMPLMWVYSSFIFMVIMMVMINLFNNSNDIMDYIFMKIINKKVMYKW